MNARKKGLFYVFPVLLISILLQAFVGKIVVFTYSLESVRPRDADLNGDGVINLQDLYIFEKYVGSYTNRVKWNPKADINQDGTVNIFDIILAASFFGRTHALIHSVAYVSPLSDQTAEFVAANFDLLITGFDVASTIGKIEALNPNIIILGYRDIMAMHPYYDDWAEVDSHEDWFLHDIHGNRLINKEWEWYAMDVGNLGWRNHYANYVKTQLDTHPFFDGILADDTWDMFSTRGWLNDAEPDPDIASRWHNDMVEMISFVKNIIGNKLLIVNTQNNDDYVGASNGKVDEGFVHASWYTLDKFIDADSWKSKVESLRSLSQSGKHYHVHSGTMIPENPTQGDLDMVHDVMIYCFASFLLGVNGEKATFGFNNINSKDGSHGYYPEFDISLGSPIGDYYSIGPAYARDFTDGKVLANPTTSSCTVNLEGEYKTSDGRAISSVTLEAHSGIILLASDT